MTFQVRCVFGVWRFQLKEKVKNTISVQTFEKKSETCENLFPLYLFKLWRRVFYNKRARSVPSPRPPAGFTVGLTWRLSDWSRWLKRIGCPCLALTSSIMTFRCDSSLMTRPPPLHTFYLFNQPMTAGAGGEWASEARPCGERGSSPAAWDQSEAERLHVCLDYFSSHVSFFSFCSFWTSVFIWRSTFLLYIYCFFSFILICRKHQVNIYPQLIK